MSIRREQCLWFVLVNPLILFRASQNQKVRLDHPHEGDDENKAPHHGSQSPAHSAESFFFLNAHCLTFGAGIGEEGGGKIWSILHSPIGLLEYRSARGRLPLHIDCKPEFGCLSSDPPGLRPGSHPAVKVAACRRVFYTKADALLVRPVR